VRARALYHRCGDQPAMHCEQKVVFGRGFHVFDCWQKPLAAIKWYVENQEYV